MRKMIISDACIHVRKTEIVCFLLRRYFSGRNKNVGPDEQDNALATKKY